MWRRRSNLHLPKCQTHKSSLLLATLLLALSCYFEQVYSLPSGLIVESSEPWPTFPRRNVAALARDGYLKGGANGFKRSISTLAKNGQLPTLRAPYDRTDGQESDTEEMHDKRNIQALARDGYRIGKSQQHDDKRSLAALARNGYIHKRDEDNQPEYYYPFFQNQVPPLSEIDGPFDERELYDYQQSVNPDMFPALARVFKRSSSQGQRGLLYDNWFYKRGELGMPVHGLYRSNSVVGVPPKRYVLSMPDYIDENDMVPEDDDSMQENDKRSVDEENKMRVNFEKRHIGSLARLGLLPSFRFSGGRYSRSGRTRLLLPSQEMYRQHSPNPNFGIREYFPPAEVDTEADPDDTFVPPPAVSPHSHPTARILRRPLNNDLPSIPSPPLPSPNLVSLPSQHDPIIKNRWQSTAKETPKFYYFKSLRVPYQRPGKRYLVLPSGDDMMLSKNYYPNSSLPSRRKNQ